VASSTAPVHPARYLTLFLLLLVGVYLLVFLTGDKQAKTKLGIDLQGGTRVTLTARTPDGSAPTHAALNQGAADHQRARERPGVSGSEVIIDGSNLVITVPGNDSSEAPQSGPDGAAVHQAGHPRDSGAGPGPAATDRGGAWCAGGCADGNAAWRSGGPPPGTPGIPPGEPGAPALPPSPAEQVPPQATPAPQPRPYPQEPPPTPARAYAGSSATAAGPTGAGHTGA